MRADAPSEGALRAGGAARVDPAVTLLAPQPQEHTAENIAAAYRGASATPFHKGLQFGAALVNHQRGSMLVQGRSAI